jgi:hypothetical protein
MHAMKRRLLFLVAALSAAATVPAAQANDPGKMFLINAVTPGVVSFSGEGTAQFNNSSSTANSFSVGSATQFGVNAPASATGDYMVDANALLGLASGAQLQQTIGTSSSAANTMAASSAAATAASTIANQKTTEKFGDDWTDYKAQNGVATVNGVTDTSKLEYTTEAQYNAKRQSFNDLTTQSEFANTTKAASNSSSNGDSGQGIIKGDFFTSNKSTSSIGATASASAENTSKATEAADSKFGKSYADYATAFASVAGTGTINTEAEKLKADALGISYDSNGAALKSDITGNQADSWEARKKSFSDEKYSALTNAGSSAGNASNESKATVSVTGVGSIATLNASDESTFNVDVATRIRNQLMENNATANGSAGGSLNTVSLANQSNSSSASAFMQAFGADTVKLNAGSNGTLESATVNGRFNVTLDAKVGSPTVSGVADTTSALQAATIALP